MICPGGPMSINFPCSSKRDLVAQGAHRGQRVGHDHDRLALAAELRDLLGALALELGVADGEDLVDEEQVGVDVDRDREAEPHVHARGVVLHRRVDEVLDAGEVDDLVEPLVELLACSGRGSSR